MAHIVLSLGVLLRSLPGVPSGIHLKAVNVYLLFYTVLLVHIVHLPNAAKSQTKSFVFTHPLQNISGRQSSRLGKQE